MKKLVSLLLTVCMCLSIGVMLTACRHEHTYKTEWSKDTTHHWHACEGENCTDVADKAEHTWNEGEITTPATADINGVKTFTCTVCGKTKQESIEFRTTVTKEEWIANFTLNNFTMHNVDGEYNQLIKLAENGMYVGLGVESDWTEMFIVLKEDNWYSLQKTDSGYVGQKYPENYNIRNELVHWISRSLFNAETEDDLGHIYDEFIYDETEKSYFNISVERKISVYFENGIIFEIKVEVTEDETSVYLTSSYSNIGSTVIDIPEFTVID